MGIYKNTMDKKIMACQLLVVRAAKSEFFTLSVLEKKIRDIPDEIFKKNGFRREDVLFFAAMGDGDYIEDILDYMAG